MVKKFYDIIPPRFIEKKKVKTEDFKAKKEEKHKEDKKTKKISRLKVILISAGIFALLLIVYLYFKLPSLKIDIWPKTEVLNFEEEIIIDTSLKENDFKNNKIIGQFIEEEKELWQEFPSTGSKGKEGKASGVIKVYNKCVPAELVSLKKGTHFLSDSGKYYVSEDKINIPPAKLKNGKVSSPSVIEAKVISEGTGEEYNIGPANFSVPKLAGTSYYYCVYAESSAKMTGGYKSSATIVSTDDIENAKSDLTKKLFADIEENLRKKASDSNFILFDNAIKKEALEFSSAVKSGAEIDKFNCKTKVKVKALVFKKFDLEEFVKNYIYSEIPSTKTILDNSIKLDYNPEIVDITGGKININLKFSATIYRPLDTKELSVLVKDKTKEEISSIVYEKLSEGGLLKINLWPFWVKKAPKDIQRIKINLNF